MKEQNTVTKIECERRRKKPSLNIKAHRKACPTFTYYVKVDDLLTEKAGGVPRVGGGGAPEANNLVCTKRQKHIYANSTHETTIFSALRSNLALRFGLMVNKIWPSGFLSLGLPDLA